MKNDTVTVENFLNNDIIDIYMISRGLVEDFFYRDFEFNGILRELKIDRSDKIISIVGPRRSGKTWYFYSLLSEFKAPMYVNFEDIAFRNMNIEEFFEVIKIFTELKYSPENMFLDEVQVLDGWESLVRSLYDRGYKVWITGSSSKLLGREIATALRGRTLTYTLLPFSFREFLRAKNIDENAHTYQQRGEVLRALREYLNYGAYPEVVFSKDKERILREYFNEIFYRDFVERHRIKSIQFGRFLFEFAFQNFSKEVSMRKIKGFFGKNVSFTTLYNYVDKLQDTLTVFFVDRYSPSVYERSSWPKKMYICDTGVSKVLGHSEDIGKRMENAVFLELLRRTNDNPLLSIYFYKSSRGNEVDFVVKEGNEIRELIQVTYASGRDDIERREIKALEKVGEELRCKNLKIITWDYEEEGEIKYVPLWKWLLK